MTNTARAIEPRVINLQRAAFVGMVEVRAGALTLSELAQVLDAFDSDRSVDETANDVLMGRRKS